MMLIVVAAFAAGLAVLLPRRLDITLGVAIAIFACVPSVMSNSLVGAGAYFTVPSVFVVVLFAIQFVLRSQEVIEAIEGAAGVLAALALFFLIALAFTYTSTSYHTLALLRNQVLVPILVFILVRMAIADRADAGIKLARVLVWAGVFNSIVAILVAFRVITQPFLDQLSQNYWYYTGFTRAIGLTDHPLVLSAILVSCIPLLPTLRPRFLQAPIALLFIVTVVLTASRTGILVATVGILLLVIVGDARRGQRVILALGVAIGGFLYGGALFSQGLSERFADDEGSAAVRGVAARYIFENWQDYFLHGLGTGGSYSAAAAAGLTTSLESPFLMYLVDFSVVATLLYFGTMVAILLMRFKTPRPVPGARLAALACLISVVGFSSLATSTGLGGIIWFLLAISYVPHVVDESKKSPAQRRAAQRRSAARAVGTRQATR